MTGYNPRWVSASLAAAAPSAAAGSFGPYSDDINPTVALRQQAAADMIHTASYPDRQQARAAIRQRLAELEQRQQKAAELREAIGRIDRQLDAEVLRHAEAAAPIQDELRSLEQQQVASLVAGAGDSQLDDKAQQLRGQLDALNDGLAEAVERAKRKRGLLEKELNSPALSTVVFVALQNELMRTGNPELLERLEAGRSVIRWHTERLRAVGRRLSELRDWLESCRARKDTTGVERYERRVRIATIEHDEAARLLSEAEGAAEALRARIVDEE